MADGRLFVPRHFAERAVERRVEEDRVVAEAVRPARLGRDLALDDAFGLEDDAAAVGERDARRRTARRCRRSRARASSSRIFANFTA